ncbi:MAG: TIGR04283 family arsenosugar biosynthesis glycosyltransferase [Holophagaceae bacterium]|nr:TIGR04283 family arsenosugar biosynthesis glycosyltransferase [Holophagaceae bacterium]
MLVSVIIPALDEAARIEACLGQFREQPGAWELIVVDGGSLDATVDLAAAAGARVLRGPRGRGPQMNAGAAAARGDILFFLHADAAVPPGVGALIRGTLGEASIALGAFRVRHAAERWAGTWKARVLRLADLRSRRTAWPYGDQGLFCRTRDFRAVDGYPDEPLMEELGLAARLRTLGAVHTRPEELRVSARRFEAGFLKAFVCMNAFPALYRLGVPPARLADWYGAPR